MHGLTAFRYLKTLAICRGDTLAAEAFVRGQAAWEDRAQIVAMLRANEISGTGEAALASAVGADLMQALVPLTVLGRLPGVRRVPPLIRTFTSLAPPTAGWVAEGKAVPASAGSFAFGQLGLAKIGAMTVATNELVRYGMVDVERTLANDLLAACGAALDQTFLDRGNAGGSGAPASITHGLSAIAAGGATVSDVDAALDEALRNIAPATNFLNVVWLMSTRLAARLSLLRGTGGAPAYPGLGLANPTLCGLPVLTSASVSAADDSDALDQVVLIDGAAVTLAEGEPILRTSTQAMIELDSQPTGDTLSTPPVAASQAYISLYQCEAVGFLVTLQANWEVRRSGAVQLVTGISL